MNFFNENKKYKYIDKPTKAMWYFAFFILAISFINYCYTDLILIVKHSFGLIDVLLKGKPLSFYSYSTNLTIFNSLSGEVPYDIFVYIPFAIWNLPLYIYESITNNPFESSIICILWAKLLLLFPLYFSLKSIKNITLFISNDTNKATLAQFLFISSLFLIHATFIISQIDIFSVCFTLIGINAYLNKDQKNFFLFFAIAISFKMLALFIFIPLLLLQNKNVVTIIKSLLLGLSFTFVSKLLFFQDKMLTKTKFDEVRFLKMLFTEKINVGTYTILLFVLAYLLICLYCYNKTIKESSERNYLTIFIPLITYSSFFLFTSAYPYWIILLVPYISILLTLKISIGTNWLLLIYTGIQSLQFLISNIKYEHIYSYKQNFGLLISKYTSNTNLTINQIFQTLQSTFEHIPLLDIIYTLYFGLFIFLIINLANKKVYESKINPHTFIANLIIIFIITILPIALNLIG